MYRSHRSKDPLSQKVSAAAHGQQVDLTNIPTFFEPFPDHLKDIPLQDYQSDHGYPLFVHRDAAPIRVNKWLASSIGAARVEGQTMCRFL